MRFSYSRVGCFAQCPKKYQFQYVDHLKTIPKQNADNALYLGLALHKGIEEWSVEAAVNEYKSHYNIITDNHINWIMQIEYQLPKVLDILPPGGEHELEVKTPGFIGYVDYVCGNTMYDFKYSNNVENYKKSSQLSIYRHYLSLVRPDLHIEHTKFLMVPKVNIRQKKNETIIEFRQRLKENSDATEIKLIEVPYSEESVTQFQEACQILETVDEFPKNKTRLCAWCDFQSFCESDGEIDYMIL